MDERSAGRVLRWLVVAGGALAGGAGCGGGPEPLPPSHRDRWVAREQAASKPAGRTPPGTLAPVDTWRQRLSEELPAPWRLGSIDPQLIAPPGWTRLEGDRGMAVWAQDGTSRQFFWVLPRNWKGQVFEPAIAAREIARNEQFLLFAPPKDVPGWGATSVVQAALGFASEVASRE